ALQGRGRDGGRARRPVLPGRGVPPGLLHEEPRAVQVLPLQLRAGPAARAAMGEGASLSGPRCPQRLCELAIPLPPQVTELPDLVRTLGSAVPRLAARPDKVRELGD